jgi:hypothetical protein
MWYTWYFHSTILIYQIAWYFHSTILIYQIARYFHTTIRIYQMYHHTSRGLVPDNTIEASLGTIEVSPRHSVLLRYHRISGTLKVSLGTFEVLLRYHRISSTLEVSPRPSVLLRYHYISGTHITLGYRIYDDILTVPDLIIPRRYLIYGDNLIVSGLSDTLLVPVIPWEYRMISIEWYLESIGCIMIASSRVSDNISTLLDVYRKNITDILLSSYILAQPSST